MPRKCTVCEHEMRADIDSALLNNETYRNISKRHGVTISALARHRGSHMRQAAVDARIMQTVQDLKMKADALSGIAGLQEFKSSLIEFIDALI